MNLLHELYQISSPSGKETIMMRFIRARLDDLGVPHYIDRMGNIYATKGMTKSYPCLVAHTDEVHGPHERGYQVYQTESNLLFGFNYLKRSHCGIGADDKNGIWICLKCLELFEAIKCVFFVSEEIGCLGSLNADMPFFDDCRYVLQCDRKGNSDLVTSYFGTSLCSKEFLLDVAPKKFEYKQSEGLITDVIILKKRRLHVSCVNISCGYYLPHTHHEFTCIEDLQKCYLFVQHIIRDCNKVYLHKTIKKVRHEPRQVDRFSKHYAEWRENRMIRP